MTYSWKKGMTIDDQWQSWQDNNDVSKVEAMDTESLKTLVEKDLGFVSVMNVIFYRAIARNPQTE